jgi:TPR repeat protein
MCIIMKGDILKKAKFHYEAAAMAGHEAARCNLGTIKGASGHVEQAIKHWTIAASAVKSCSYACLENKR